MRSYILFGPAKSEHTNISSTYTRFAATKQPTKTGSSHQQLSAGDKK